MLSKLNIKNVTTSIRTVKKEQMKNKCSFYGEKHSPGGPTLVLIYSILLAPYCAIGMNGPFHDREFGVWVLENVKATCPNILHSKGTGKIKRT